MQTWFSDALLGAVLAVLLLVGAAAVVFWLCRYLLDAWSTVRRDRGDDAP